MAIRKIALDNIDNVVNNDSVDATVVLDATTATAYNDSVKAAEHVEEVEKELEKKAEDVITDAPEAPKVKSDSIYTKVKLSESIEDFKLSDIDGSKDEADRYIEFDMFDFIYSLFSSESDSLTRPLKALSNEKRGRGRKSADDTASSFMYQGSDVYDSDTGEKGAEGVAQISTDTDGNVVLYQDKESQFDKVIALCEEYGFKYEGPTPKKAPWVRWNYSFKIIVPTYADGYPMEVEDYFDKIGIPMEEVMPAEFLKGRAKDYKKLDDEVAVEVIYKKHRDRAGNSNDPIEGFVKDMFKELDSMGVKYNRKELKDRMIAEFSDEYPEDEE